MGRKVHPIGFRLRINKTWEGRWYAEGQEYVNQLAPRLRLARSGSQKLPELVFLGSRSSVFPESEDGCAHCQARHAHRS